MLGLSKILRLGEGRAVKRLGAVADQVIALEDTYSGLSDDELRAKTEEFRSQLADGSSLDDILLDAFAVAREASWRDELRAKTEEFRSQLADGSSLDDILLDAFAVAREASWRVLGQKHYRVQVMGGAALHWGYVAEMKTGEGKTLTCVLPAYLNALAGKGVHVVTVNDYLARRDSEWMGRVHRFLGLTTDVILSDKQPAER
ncbi:hypothetical protein MTQ16_00450, partial [Corynebacterium bovis]